MNDTLVEKYAVIAQTIAQEKGQFKLFALLKREAYPWEWDVVISAQWLPGENEMESLKFIFAKIRAVLNQQEFFNIAKIVLLDVREPFVKELQTFLEEHNNPQTFSHTEIQDIDFREGLMIVSPANPQADIPNSSELLLKASPWIRKAAKQGNKEAQNTLGLMYLKGEGVKKNLRLAKTWFKKAAALGHTPAQNHLEALHN